MMPQFGMDGPVLDGTTWYNSKTGDSFKVRSTIIEDNTMQLQAYDGRTFKLDRLEDYVQWTGTDAPPTKPMNPESPKSVNADLPPEIAAEIGQSPEGDDSLIDPEDLAIINGIGRQDKQPSAALATKAAPVAPAGDRAFIERALSKAKFPNWNIVMKWPDFPESEITILAKSMGIDVEEIADYYLDNITKEFDSFMGNIRRQLYEYICDKVGVPRNVEVEQQEKVKKPATPKKPVAPKKPTVKKK